MKKSAFLILTVAFSLAFCFSHASAQINLGIVNARAVRLPSPVYPAAAKAVRATGIVNVQVMIDEEGNVISAQAISGHPLLRRAAEEAARLAKFPPNRVGGQLVKATGIIIYNFVSTAGWQEIGFILGAFEKGLPENNRDFDNLSSRLPEEIAGERANLEALSRKIKENLNIERAEQIKNFLSSIQKKLSDRKIESWLLELGLIKGRVAGSLNNDRELAKNLKAARKLLENRPGELAENTINSLRALSAYADNVKFTQADKERIRELSRPSF